MFIIYDYGDFMSNLREFCDPWKEYSFRRIMKRSLWPYNNNRSEEMSNSSFLKLEGGVKVENTYIRK